MRLVRYFQLLTLFLQCSHSAWTQENPPKSVPLLVQQQADLAIHFGLHIERVVKLGMHAWKSNASEFPSLDPTNLDDVKLVIDYLLLHDQGKLNHSPEFMHAYGIDGDSILSRLYRIYAIPFERLGEEERWVRNTVVNDLNHVDSQVGKDFFATRNISRNKVISLKRLEIIADRVDRLMDPVSTEEFRRTTIDPITYMERYIKYRPRPSQPDETIEVPVDFETIDRKIGIKLIQHYHEIIPSLLKYKKAKRGYTQDVFLHRAQSRWKHTFK